MDRSSSWTWRIAPVRVAEARTRPQPATRALRSTGSRSRNSGLVTSTTAVSVAW